MLQPIRRGWPDEGRGIVQGGPLRRLLERVPAAATVLNAGAGDGLFTAHLLGRPGLRELIEVDYSYARQARRTVDGRQRIAGCSLTGIPLRSGTVGLILCSEVLEHIADDGRALDEMRRVLAPGGWLLISVPTPPAIPDPNHVREGYTSQALTGLLRARGFEIQAKEFCMFFGFKTLLRWWRVAEWTPRAVIWALAHLDLICPLGKPMDLIILAQAV